MLDQQRQCFLLRDGIEALIARPVYYALVNLAEEQPVDGRPQLGVWSGGEFFSLVPAMTDSAPMRTP